VEVLRDYYRTDYSGTDAQIVDKLSIPPDGMQRVQRSCAGCCYLILLFTRRGRPHHIAFAPMNLNGLRSAQFWAHRRGLHSLSNDRRATGFAIAVTRQFPRGARRWQRNLMRNAISASGSGLQGAFESNDALKVVGRVNLSDRGLMGGWVGAQELRTRGGRGAVATEDPSGPSAIIMCDPTRLPSPEEILSKAL
jgi:hypothetical protein